MTNLLKAARQSIQRRRNIRATIEELHNLTDYELKDIGIIRADIERVAYGLIEMHRAVRDANN